MIDVKNDCSFLVEWFLDNYLTLNADKCLLLVSGRKYEAMYESVGDALLWVENSVKSLSLIIDSESQFSYCPLLGMFGSCKLNNKV